MRGANRIMAMAAAAVCLLSAVTPVAAAKAPHRPLLHVKVRIRVFYDPNFPRNTMNLTVTFAPKTVNIGTVVLDISNSDNDPHQFEINGKETKLIGGGGKAVLTVTFKRAGLYPVAITAEAPMQLNSALRVIK
jgi:hypothetical protein